MPTDFSPRSQNSGPAGTTAKHGSHFLELTRKAAKLIKQEKSSGGVLS